MFQFLLVTLVLIEVIFLIPQCGGNCIWYKVCYTDDDDKSLNCAYDGQGFQITDAEAQKTMRRLCPELFTNRKLNNKMM